MSGSTHMPPAGGEALARQFVAGKRFFLENFGVEPLDVWLPDSFGYSGALPQIVKAAGSRWFLTQKISWNDTNRFPHHTFLWEGIDGTRIFTHFPPADTYSSDVSAAHLAHAQRNYREKGAANTSLLPFGWGDGGGGPTREMLAAAYRTADLEGSPRVQLSGPETFFRAAEAEYPEPPVFSGELYLEFHRGTYTSQARTKRGNRRSEHLLREAELWATTAAIRKDSPYPYDELERVWRTVLLQQFHDILPGSSIAWVHQEAERNYAQVAETLERLIAEALAAVVHSDSGTLSVNAGPFPVAGVPAFGGGTPTAPVTAQLEHGRGGWTLRSEALEITIDDAGLLTSLLDRGAGRQLVPAGLAGNLFQVFRDTPNQWDAWDLDEHYKSTVAELRKADFVEPLEKDRTPGLRIRHSFGDSFLTEEIRLSQDGTAVELGIEVDWHEQQKLLKLAFPLDLLAERAASEIQFGHIHRPTHSNTSWDAARFETVAHRWVQVAEPGYGVALTNDATYCYDIGRAALADGAGTYTS
ncbi:MAG TPA: glycoside hydrolase family 38 C-terminal domain-containing protein, partial [Arthrobacter sp.]|nr:glycoside hydrolase family 38 C-terminal domain-containing protein [Arthrobacter sp.]